MRGRSRGRVGVRPRRAEWRTGMTGDGSLGWFSVVATLEVLGLRRRTGKIQVVADGDVYGIHVDAGRIILATSSNQALRLGLLLLRRGLVEPLYLQDVLRGRRPAGDRAALGRIRVAGGVLSRADLAVGVQEPCVEVIARILDFDTGTFYFAGDEPVVNTIEVVPLDTDHLLAQASIRQRERMATRAMD